MSSPILVHCRFCHWVLTSWVHLDEMEDYASSRLDKATETQVCRKAVVAPGCNCIATTLYCASNIYHPSVALEVWEVAVMEAVQATISVRCCKHAFCRGCSIN